MTHRITSVRPLENYTLSVIFQNGAEKSYDMRTLYPVFPQFRAFEEVKGLFQQVTVDTGGYGISWNDELDLDAEEIWINGIDVQPKHSVDSRAALAYSLTAARNAAGLTQKQLSEATGIYQADISKIERGLANPSLSTLQRLAEGLGMELKLQFVMRDP